MSRYRGRKIYRTKNSLYAKELKEKGLRYFRYYETPKFKELTAQQKVSMDIISHAWKSGDRFYKLAHQYYGDAELWWIIARFNNKPTEGHVQLGENIRIPTPLDRIRELYGV